MTTGPGAREQVKKIFESSDSHPDPPEPPHGWEGGVATHTGGGVTTREWRNEERELRVGYDLDELTVYLERIEWDEIINDWSFAGSIPEAATDCASDEEAMQIAFELMETIEEDGLDGVRG